MEWSITLFEQLIINQISVPSPAFESLRNYGLLREGANCMKGRGFVAQDINVSEVQNRLDDPCDPCSSSSCI
jgi:hypothetical protein